MLWLADTSASGTVEYTSTSQSPSLILWCSLSCTPPPKALSTPWSVLLPGHTIYRCVYSLLPSDRHKTWAHPTAWDLHGHMFSWELCLHSCVIFCYWRGHSRCKGHGFLLGGHHYWTLCKCVTTTVWSGRVTASFLCILLHEVLCHFLVETPCPVSPPWLLAPPKAAFQKPPHKSWSPTPLLNTTGGDCLSKCCWWQLNHV